MHPLFGQALTEIDAAFAKYVRYVPQPQKVPFKQHFIFRYKEQTVQQALVQKLARVISGLRASAHLLDQGHVQEVGILQRMLDELGEDIAFLAVAITNDTVTPMHKQYLASFYEEEFDLNSGKPLHRRKRHQVPRDKIVAYVTRVLGGSGPVDPSTAIDTHHTLNKVYSGFVHAASPHIMDMYGGNPARFHTAGLLGSPLVEHQQDDLWNYFYRAIGQAVIIGKAFGDVPTVTRLLAYVTHFEKCSGTSFRAETVAAMRKDQKK